MNQTLDKGFEAYSSRDVKIINKKMSVATSVATSLATSVALSVATSVATSVTLKTAFR